MATGLFRNAVFLARASAIPNEGMSTYTICRSIIQKTMECNQWLQTDERKVNPMKDPICTGLSAMLVSALRAG
jgi:hypothetical protein